MSKTMRLAVALLVVALGLFALSGQTPEAQPATGAPAIEARRILLQRAMAVQDRHTKALLAIPGVVGTATGLTANGQPAVLVLTESPGVGGIAGSLRSPTLQISCARRQPLRGSSRKLCQYIHLSKYWTAPKGGDEGGLPPIPLVGPLFRRPRGTVIACLYSGWRTPPGGPSRRMREFSVRFRRIAPSLREIFLSKERHTEENFWIE